jgi:hypothetical protein
VSACTCAVALAIGPALVEHEQRHREPEEGGGALHVVRQQRSAAHRRHRQALARASVNPPRAAACRSRSVCSDGRLACATGPQRIGVGRHVGRRIRATRWPAVATAGTRAATPAGLRHGHLGLGIHHVDAEALRLRLDTRQIVLTALAGLRSAAYDLLDTLEIGDRFLQHLQLLLARQQRREHPARPAMPIRQRLWPHGPIRPEVQIGHVSARLALMEHQQRLLHTT